MDYWEAIDYLLALPDLERFSSGPGGLTMSMECMRALMSKLGNPQNGRKTIHITGSKGKGSTSTMIASVLHENGLRVGLYTSPHLHDYVERLCFDMLPISRFDFADAVDEIRDAIDDVNASDLGPVSTFGAITALFFHLCRKNNVDWQVVEVGLGGTQDATNVFAEKDAAVITAISLEHTNILGNSCAEIAREKSGIITPGCVAILAPQTDRSVNDIVKQTCIANNARLLDVAEELAIRPVAHDSNGQSFIVDSKRKTYRLHTAMLGLHQLDNASTALACIEAIADKIEGFDPASIDAGIANAEIAGRVEQLTKHPLAVVDGAHNRESMKALVDTLDRHFDFDDAIFILGANSDKNIAAMLTEIKQLEPKLVIATRSGNQKAMGPEAIATEARKLGMEARVTQNIGDAIGMAKEFAELNDMVCITGSLYVAGEAREKILSLPVSR